MKAVMKLADGVGLHSFEPARLREGQARVQVVAAGVCGTDQHIADGEYANEPPVVMGHEITGIVAETRGDDSLVGRRVVLETYFSTCGHCSMCRDGRPNLCPERRSLGSFEDGGFAPEVVVPISNLHEVPPQVEDMAAVLFEPLACVTNCLLDPARVEAGDEVLVIGPGTMGLLATQVAMAMGGTVTCVGLERDEKNLQIAAEYGAVTTHTAAEDAYDVVIDCTGAPSAIAAGLRAARAGANFVELGIVGQDIEVPWDLVLYRELTVTSGFASTPRSWRRAVDLVANGYVHFEGLVTHRFPLDRWKEAFAAVGREGIKTVLVPNYRAANREESIRRAAR